MTQNIGIGPSGKSRFSKVATLAGAALALPLAANAGIVTGTPDVTLNATDGTDQTYTLNVAGTDQFTFTASFTTDNDTVTPLGGNTYIGGVGSIFQEPIVATPLQPPFVVDGTSSFESVTGSLQSSKTVAKLKMWGPWPSDGSTAYLGVTFQIGGSPVYGWIELSATTPTGGPIVPTGFSTSAITASTIIVDAYAYQTDGTGITVGDTGTAPEPSSLAMFALGAAGIGALRARRKRVV